MKMVKVYKHSERAITEGEHFGTRGVALEVAIFPLKWDDDKSIKAIAKGIEHFINNRCMNCGEMMEDVSPTADATECPHCLAVRWNTGEWDMTQVKETP
jgi:hypothetical protein